MKSNANTWGNRVRAVAISCDKNTAQADLVSYQKPIWLNMEHYNVYKSNFIEKYVIHKMPHSIIVDTQGRVVFNGNPESR